MTRHLLSFVETSSNMSVFPPWGRSPMYPIKDASLLHSEAIVGHFTWNKQGAERHLHLSGGARGTAEKTEVGKSARLAEPNSTGLHTARLAVYDFEKLDPLASPFLRVPYDFIGTRSTRDVEDALNTSLTRNSGASVLPREWDFSDENHIEAVIGMKAGEFGNDEFRRPDRSGPLASPVEQVVKIPMDPPWNAIVQLRNVRGTSPKDFGFSHLME